MIGGLRGLSVTLVATLAVVLAGPAAHAASIPEIRVAHRGATTSTIAEGTMPASQYAVRNNADYLDGDLRWTKDGSDADTVGTVVISHDSTLDRITNCSGYVSAWLWSSIYDKCRTDVGAQRLIRLVDLLRYGNSVGKSFALEIKLSSITDDQATQLWNLVKASRVQLEAGPSALPALNKIKKRDAADPYHRLDYALITVGVPGWPTVSTIKSTGTAVHAALYVPADVVQTYQQANIRVFVFTGRDEADYAKMVAKKPYGVVVDDVARFNRWRAAHPTT